MQNYGPFLWRHTWSLAVEEHFYLLLALVLGLLSTRARRRGDADPFAHWGRIVVVGMAAVFAGRVVQVAVGAPSDLVHYGTHSRLDALLFGSLLAWAISVIRRRS